MAGDHNWVAIAFARRVVCYSFNEAIGWTLRYVSPTVPADIEHVAISNKFGEIGAKMVAVSYGPTVRLFACGSGGSGVGSWYAEGGGRQSISGLGNHQKKKKKKRGYCGSHNCGNEGGVSCRGRAVWLLPPSYDAKDNPSAAPRSARGQYDLQRSINK